MKERGGEGRGERIGGGGGRKGKGREGKEEGNTQETGRN